MADGSRPMPPARLVLRTTEEIPGARQNATFTILFHARAAKNSAGRHRDETEEATDSRRCLMKASDTQFLPAT